jgi:hypothetical protein
MKNNIVHIPLYASFKALQSFPSENNVTENSYNNVTPEIKPIKGDIFVKNDKISVIPGDWILFGTASTPDVDLVNDSILDMQYAFGDSLREFVENGKIFYEHGYKHAGDKNKHLDIDVPIGKPIAAEIHENKLYVWILLDKNHELAQKVYKHLTNDDNRFFNKIGLSIGAIPMGKPTTKVIGNSYVNVPPKMRLYEVSVTGQPININTYVKILKSLYNTIEKALEDKNMEEKLKDRLKNKEENLDEKDKLSLDLSDESPEEENNENRELENMDQKPEDEMENKEETEVEEDLEKSEEEKVMFNYILDKLDFIEEKLNDVLNRGPEKQETEEIEETPSVGTEELKSVLNRMEKIESHLFSIEKTLKSAVDLIEYQLESAKNYNNTNSLDEKFESLKSALLNEVKEFVSKEVSNVTKSLGSLQEEVKNIPTTKSFKVGVNSSHPEIGLMDQNFEQKVKSIISNKSKVNDLERRMQEFLDFKGSPYQISEKKKELVEYVKSAYDLDQNEFELIYRNYKSKKKISE